MNLLEALKALDPKNDEHWTKEGLPLLDVLNQMTGGTVSRAEINSALPGFNRSNAETMIGDEPVVPPPPPQPWAAPVQHHEVGETTVLVDKQRTTEVTDNEQGMTSLEMAQARLQVAQVAAKEANAELLAAQEEYNREVDKHKAENTYSFADIVKMSQAASIAEQAGVVAKAEQFKQQLLAMPDQM